MLRGTPVELAVNLADRMALDVTLRVDAAVAKVVASDRKAREARGGHQVAGTAAARGGKDWSETAMPDFYSQALELSLKMLTNEQLKRFEAGLPAIAAEIVADAVEIVEDGADG